MAGAVAARRASWLPRPPAPRLRSRPTLFCERVGDYRADVRRVSRREAAVIAAVCAALGAQRWLRALHHEQAEARDHELAPLARVRAWSGLPAEAPLFETLFVYENFPMGGGGTEGISPPSWRRRRTRRSAPTTPFRWWWRPSPTGCAPPATFDARRLDAPPSAACWPPTCACWSSCRRRPPTSAARAWSRWATRSARRVLEEWNRTAPSPIPRASIHRLFAEQARHAPAVALAVACGDETLSYAELDARANRLAHHLRARGVGPETAWRVCLERAPEPIAAHAGHAQGRRRLRPARPRLSRASGWRACWRTPAWPCW